MFIVEDGTVVENANALVSVTEADQYFAMRQVTEWGNLLLEEKQAAIVKATDYLSTVYSNSFQGVIVSQAQLLPFPRKLMVIDDYTVSDETVPLNVRKAVLELALRSLEGSLQEDLGERVKREKVDVLETEYFESGSQQKRYPQVYNLIKRYLNKGSSANNIGLVRV